MARNQDEMTDEEIAELRENMDEQREEIRAALAEDLGGISDDYRADQPVADGGESECDSAE